MTKKEINENKLGDKLEDLFMLIRKVLRDPGQLVELEDAMDMVVGIARDYTDYTDYTDSHFIEDIYKEDRCPCHPDKCNWYKGPVKDMRTSMGLGAKEPYEG